MIEFLNSPVNTQENNKILQAIKTLLLEKKFKFFNIENFSDIKQLNKQILTLIKIVIEENNVVFEQEILAYNLDNLTISQYLSHDSKQLKLKMKYLTSEEIIAINFDNNFNNQDYSLSIKTFLMSMAQSGIVMYEWLSTSNYLTTIESWLKKAIEDNRNKLTINLQKITVDPNAIDISFVDRNQIKDSQFLKIGFEYNESSTQIFKLKLRDYLTNQDLQTALNDHLIARGPINLGVEYNYKNFINNNQLKLWVEKNWISFNLADLTIRNQKINLNPNFLTFMPISDQQKSTIANPWTRNFVLKLNYQTQSIPVTFDTKFQFLAPIDYLEIKQAFLNQVSSLKIDAKNFAKAQNFYEVNDWIKQQISMHIKTITIDKVSYPVDLSNSLVKDQKITGQKNQEKVNFQFRNGLIWLKDIFLDLRMINFVEWVFKQILDYLKIYKPQMRFNLKKITSDKKWKDALKLVMTRFNFQNEFNGIEWRINQENETIYQLNNIKNGQASQILTITGGDKVEKVTMYFGEIDKINQHVFADSIHNLKALEKTGFDFQGNSLSLTFGQTLEKIQTFFKDDDDFKKVKLTSRMPSSKKLESFNFRALKKSDIFYQIIQIEIGTLKSNDITINFKNVVKTANYIFQYVQEKFNNLSKLPIDLKKLPSDKTWQDVLNILIDQFKTDQDFKDVIWSIDDNGKQICERILWSNPLWKNQQFVTIKLGTNQHRNKFNFEQISKIAKHRFNDAFAKLEAFNQTNPFDLKGQLSPYHVWKDVVKKMQIYFNSDIDFLGIKWEINGLLEMMKDVNLINGLSWNNIKLSLESFWNSCVIYFKNNNKTDEQRWLDIYKKLEKFNENNPFDLKGLTSENQWTKVLEKIRMYFKYDGDFYQLKIATNKSDELINFFGIYNGKSSKEVQIIWENKYFWTKMYFKNILKTDIDKFQSATVKLQSFNVADPFDAKWQITSKDSWQRALDLVVSYFKQDSDFSIVSWKVNLAEKPFFNEKTKDWSGYYRESKTQYFFNNLYILWNNREQFIKFCWKNISKSDEHKFYDVTKELKRFNSDDNGFVLKNIKSDNTWRDALNEMKVHFADKSDFKDVFWTINSEFSIIKDSTFNSLKRSNWQNLNVKINALSETIQVYFKNILKSQIEIRFSTAAEKLKKYNHWNDGFDLLGASSDITFKQAVDKLWASDDVFKGINYQLAEHLDSELGRDVSFGLKSNTHGSTYAQVTLKLDNFVSEKLNVYFRNIQLIDKHRMTIAVKKLKNYSSPHEGFDLSGLSSDDTFNQAIRTNLRNSNKIFSTIWFDTSAGMDTKLGDGYDYDDQRKTVSANVSLELNNLKEIVTMFFKNIWPSEQFKQHFNKEKERFDRVVKELKSRNWNNRLNVAMMGIRRSNTWDKLLKTIKDYYETRNPDFKGIRWEVDQPDQKIESGWYVKAGRGKFGGAYYLVAFAGHTFRVFLHNRFASGDITLYFYILDHD